MTVLLQEHLTRLSLVRYLLRQAEHQLIAAAPVRCIALLLLHDSLEMFLDTTAQAIGAPLGQRREFKEYWSNFEKTTPPIKLPLARPMEKLNRARVDLKHHGIRPPDDQLQEYVILTKTFLDEVCLECFGIALDEASMLNLIKDDRVRELLQIAQRAIQNGNLSEAFINAAKGLSYGLLAGRRSRLSDQFSLSRIRNAIPGDLSRIIINIMIEIEQEISFLSLGVDLRNYERFLGLTPAVQRSVSGKFSVILKSPLSNPNYG